MRKLLIILCLLIAIPASAGSKCFLTQPLVAYENLQRFLVVCKSSVASQNIDQMASIFSADIHAGQAILLPVGSLIQVMEVTPMVTSFSTNGFIYFTMTNAIFCK